MITTHWGKPKFLPFKKMVTRVAAKIPTARVSVAEEPVASYGAHLIHVRPIEPSYSNVELSDHSDTVNSDSDTSIVSALKTVNVDVHNSFM